jgi:hypothetical protein
MLERPSASLRRSNRRGASEASLVNLTSGNCLSEANAVSEVSFAGPLRREHRSEAEGRSSMSGSRGPSAARPTLGRV